MCIGKKECAKVNEKKEKLQKCLLLLNIRELNLEFKKVKSKCKKWISKVLWNATKASC